MIFVIQIIRSIIQIETIVQQTKKYEKEDKNFEL